MAATAGDQISSVGPENLHFDQHHGDAVSDALKHDSSHRMTGGSAVLRSRHISTSISRRDRQFWQIDWRRSGDILSGMCSSAPSLHNLELTIDRKWAFSNPLLTPSVTFRVFPVIILDGGSEPGRKAIEHSSSCDNVLQMTRAIYSAVVQFFFNKNYWVTLPAVTPESRGI